VLELCVNMEIILALAGVAIIPIIVVVFLPRDRSFFEKSLVRGFGLGVYLMLVILLFYEAVEEKGAATAFGWLLGGLAVSLVIGFLFKEFHHHHSEEEKQETHSRASTWRVLVSDFAHNIVDGIAIIAGFSLGPAVGAVAFLGVLGHQIVQQVGQQILLVESGVAPKRAIFISLLIALSIFLGFLVQDIEIEAVLLALSAGIVAWKVWTDLIHLKWDKKTAAGFLAGALILAAILLSIPHEHGQEEEHLEGAHEEGEEI